jgi:hypothetical protein
VSGAGEARYGQTQVCCAESGDGTWVMGHLVSGIGGVAPASVASTLDPRTVRAGRIGELIVLYKDGRFGSDTTAT